MRKHDVNEINLKVYDVELSDDQMIIRWTSDIGFGEYSIFLVLCQSVDIHFRPQNAHFVRLS